MNKIQGKTTYRHPEARAAAVLRTAPAEVPSVASHPDKEAILKEFTASQQISENSRKTYRDAVTQFFNWVDTTGRVLPALTETDIVAFGDHLARTGHKVLTVRVYLIALRKFYDWAERMRLYRNISAGMKLPRKPSMGGGERFMKMHLSDAEASRLLDHYRGHPRNFAMVNLMLRTGLRTVEVSRSRIDDIRQRSGRRVLLVWGKGMQGTDPNVYVILTDAAWQPLRDYLATRPGARGAEPLFATEGRGSHESRDAEGHPYTRNHSGGPMSTRLIQDIVKRGMRAIGLDSHEYSAHSLRHTTGTEMIRKGASVLDVQRTLRHSSVNTTMIYIASIQDEEHLRNAPEALLDRSFSDGADNQENKER